MIAANVSVKKTGVDLRVAAARTWTVVSRMG